MAAGGLREFLWAWVGPDDAWVRPGDVGLPAGTGLRRTPGPRREVAAPAGASVDYYVRLEHGQETNPSPAALTRALLLDEEEGTHLYVLARQLANEGPGATAIPTQGARARAASGLQSRVPRTLVERPPHNWGSCSFQSR